MGKEYYLKSLTKMKFVQQLFKKKSCFLGAIFLFKFVMFNVTGLFTHDWDLEMPYCIASGCHNNTPSGLSFHHLFY